MSKSSKPPIAAAGILFLTHADEVLLVRRTDAGDHPGEWSVPGGKLKRGETAEDAARREAEEEVGWADDAATLTEWTRRNRDGVDFTTFLCRIAEPFHPVLSDEHDAARWVGRKSLG